MKDEYILEYRTFETERNLERNQIHNTEEEKDKYTKNVRLDTTKDIKEMYSDLKLHLKLLVENCSKNVRS